MAWGLSNTEEEGERIAAVREYFYEHFPHATIRDSYDPGRMAQVFLVDTNDAAVVHTVVVSTQFLEAYPPGQIATVLLGYRVAEYLSAAMGAEVRITPWGVEGKKD